MSRDQRRGRRKFASTVEDVECQIEDIHRNAQRTVSGAPCQECLPIDSRDDPLQHYVKIDECFEPDDAELKIVVHRKELEQQLMLDAEHQQPDVANLNLALAM